jgi:hypothetical protein
MARKTASARRGSGAARWYRREPGGRAAVVSQPWEIGRTVRSLIVLLHEMQRSLCFLANTPRELERTRRQLAWLRHEVAQRIQRCVLLPPSRVRTRCLDALRALDDELVSTELVRRAVAAGASPYFTTESCQPPYKPADGDATSALGASVSMRFLARSEHLAANRRTLLKRQARCSRMKLKSPCV